MRPIESLLLLANLLTFFLLVVPLPRAARWTRSSAIAALAIAAAQVVVEGPRWQMIPAYALSGVFFLVSLLQGRRPADGANGRRRGRRVAAGLGAGLGALGVATSIVLPIVIPVFRFPRPTGPYEIGTVTYHWVDAERPEVFTADPDDRRELMVQVWYPAQGGP